MNGVADFQGKLQTITFAVQHATAGSKSATLGV